MSQPVSPPMAERSGLERAMGCLLPLLLVLGLTWWCVNRGSLPFGSQATPTRAPAAGWRGLPLPDGTRLDFAAELSAVAIFPLRQSRARSWLLQQLPTYGFHFMGESGGTDRWALGATIYTITWGLSGEQESRARLETSAR